MRWVLDTVSEWSVAELFRSASQPLVKNDHRRIVLEGLDVDPGSGAVHCEVAVETPTGTSRWRLTIGSADDVKNSSVQSAGLVIRANIEEWWDTGGPVNGDCLSAQRLDL
ncbi:hypothetical protein GCM10009613_31970 [Pseudonocardia kongjuensis]|uniref:Uncharacterized protein n=1 Tax=Pseudonocardia kongjuensis TaxID=102227 RepID=A0ABN1XZX5_9PSEU